MEKIRKLKEFFIKEKIDGYFIPKNDEFLENTFQNIVTDCVTYLALLALTVFH